MGSFDPPDKRYPPPKAGEPPLHRAARVGDHAAIRELVAAGADVNTTFDIELEPGMSERPATPLMIAAGSADGANEATVRLLLELGADASIVLAGANAADFAFEGLGWNYPPGGDAARARLVLDAGSTLPADQDYLNDLLCAAAELGDAERVRLLLDRGASAAGYWDPEEARKSELKRMAEMAEYLAKQPDVFASLPEEIRDSFEESRRKREEKEFARRTTAPYGWQIPLFRAAESGSAETVRALISAGADANARDNSSRTAMYNANSLEVIRDLMREGVSVEDADEYGWSPLIDAVFAGPRALPRVKALIDAGANTNAVSEHGYTVFMKAVGSGRYPELLRLLVARGADPHATTEHGSNAFHAAIDADGPGSTEESVRDTLGYLKQLGVNINQLTEGGWSPLAVASSAGTELEVRVLCELGADPNGASPQQLSSDGPSARRAAPPLCLAAKHSRGRVDVKIDVLLKAGADPLATTSEGHTALTLAVASLCEEGPTYADSFRAFYRGLGQLSFDGRATPATLDVFIAEATPMMRAYVERFASEIPVDNKYAFSLQRRIDQVAAIVSLAVHEGWARHQRRKNLAN